MTAQRKALLSINATDHPELVAWQEQYGR